MKEEGHNEDTLTANPQAARGAALVCTLALLSLVSLSSDSMHAHLPTFSLSLSHSHTHTHTHFSAQLALADTTGGRDQVAEVRRQWKEKGWGKGVDK